MAGVSNYVKTATMGEMRITLASGALLECDFDLGDLTVGPFGRRLNELVKMRRRGKRVSEAYGEKADPQLAFSCWAPNWIGNDAVAPGSELEALLGVGAYGSEASTSGAGTDRPFTCNIRFKFNGVPFGDAFDEILTCADCHVLGNFAEAMDGNKLSFSAEVLGNVVLVHGGNTVTLSQITL